MICHIDELESDPKSGTITALQTKDGTVTLTAGGIEIGNWFGFFSQQFQRGAQCTITPLEIAATDSSVVSNYIVTLPESRFEVFVEEVLRDGVWLRSAMATALSDSWVGDFVLRLGVGATDYPFAGSGGRISRHRGWNTYHQFPACEVVILGPNKTIRTKMTATNALGRLAAMSYWRDQPDGSWIQHHRLIVKRCDLDHVVMRFRNSVSDSRNSRWLHSHLLRAPFWSLNEAVLSYFPVKCFPTMQAQGIIAMGTGQSIRIRSRVVVGTI